MFMVYGIVHVQHPWDDPIKVLPSFGNLQNVFTWGDAVGWRIVEQTSKSPVGFPPVSLDFFFFFYIILPALLWLWGWISLWQKLIKGKAIPLQALTSPVGSSMLRIPDCKKIGTWIWQGYQPYAPAAFTQRKYSWYSFPLEDESIAGP
jgi:hypothetical protein